MSQHGSIVNYDGSRSCILWSNKIPQPGQSSHRVCPAIPSCAFPCIVEAGMFSHLSVQTDTGQQGMEVLNTFTITVSLKCKSSSYFQCC